MKKVKIYTLTDPRNNEIRYIGKTVGSLKNRLCGHISAAITNKEQNHRSNWIKQLIRIDLLPEIELVEEVEENFWKQTEQYWIAQFKAWNFSLVNMTEGGDGNNNQIFSKESIEKRAQAIRGVPRPQEVREKISRGHKGKKISETTKEKLRAINTGKKQTEETKAKRYKAVIKLSSDDNFIAEYPSLQHAALENKTGRGAIQNCCVGRCKTAAGFKWRYKNADDYKI
jgi:hypothetical protein